MRNTIDFSPLYQSAIGFDRMASLLDNLARDSKPSYPPYNIELVEENRYRITMAVAGFAEEDLEITTEQNTLVIAGRQDGREEKREYLYQGIAERNFERKFQLAEHVRVESARLENGLLHVELKREIPEAMKPRRIAIGSDLLEQQDAA
ncbi:Hsp20 family protein [Pseudohaliea sp.]|uniref:Hsp20 family protein n=1 Tax=Pseudohaliea sp. TaxID=2740289 RepID=UPI0032EF85C3